MPDRLTLRLSWSISIWPFRRSGTEDLTLLPSFSEKVEADAGSTLFVFDRDGLYLRGDLVRPPRRG
jgi:hypothetical protein